LAAILANTQAGLRFLNRPAPDLDELRAILDDSARDVKRAGGVISSLRNMLRHHERETERVDLGDLVRDTLVLLRSELVDRRVEITVRAPSGAVALADRGQIQQVLLNLVLNAAEAVAELPAEQRRAEIRIHATSGGTIRTIISDTGPGVPVEMLDTIFDRFWTTKRHGMGMGLAISRTIVDRHGGRIWVENDAAGGARFCFELPIGGPISGEFPTPVAIVADAGTPKR
jgi:signal transduction histidine kinase